MLSDSRIRSSSPLVAATVVLVLAAGLGVVSHRNAVIPLAIGVLALGFVITVISPRSALVVLVLTLAVEFKGFPFPGSRQVFLLQKGALLAVFIVVMCVRGLRPQGAWPLGGLVLLLFLTVTVATPLPQLTLGQGLQSLLSLGLGWIAAMCVWREPRERTALLWTVALLPVLSLALGFLLSPVGVQPFGQDYTGAFRLQGATIPAVLALFATTGAAASALLSHVPSSRRRAAVGAVVNLLIVLLSGGRGGLAASLVIVLPMLIRSLRNLPGPLAGRVLAAGAVLITAVGVLVAYIPVIVQRSSADPNGDALNSSGRTEAWAYFIHITTTVNPCFGRGLGAGPLASENAVGLRATFVAQHNEYVRFFLEGGYVGLAIMVLAIAVFMTLVVRSSPSVLRPDLIALFIGFALFSATDNTMTDFKFFVPFGILCAVALSWVQPEKGDPPAQRVLQKQVLVSS